MTRFLFVLLNSKFLKYIFFLIPEYGGNGGTIQSIIDVWEKRIEAYSGYYREEENYGLDEHKRAELQRIPTNFFGSEGSFRQLNID